MNEAPPQDLAVGCYVALLNHGAQAQHVRATPSQSRRWASFSLSPLYSHRNARASSHHFWADLTPFPLQVGATFAQLGLDPAVKTCEVTDLWAGERAGPTGAASGEVARLLGPRTGAALLWLTNCS